MKRLQLDDGTYREIAEDGDVVRPSMMVMDATQRAIADAGTPAANAYADYVQRLSDAWRTPQ